MDPSKRDETRKEDGMGGPKWRLGTGSQFERPDYITRSGGLAEWAAYGAVTQRQIHRRMDLKPAFNLLLARIRVLRTMVE